MKLFVRIGVTALTLLFATHLSHSSLFAADKARPDNRPPGAPPSQVNGLPFGKYLISPGYTNAIRKSVIQFENKFGPCDDAKIEGRLTVVSPKVPVEIPGHGLAPQWIDVMSISGCNNKFARPVLVAQLPKAAQFYPLLKGDGRSGPITQWDVIQFLFPLERGIAKKQGCAAADKIRILGHDLIEQKEDEEESRWREIWNIMNCKGFKKVTLAFQTDADGKTRFTLEPATLK